ncbi:hypothetical protein RhiirA1_486758 [Rhizophagus irregularis]|uniref:Uncharacterized protein n=1 Tax=Rhizophagus irregularis TaxID=588596 RepID=A0A2N0QGY6_9GLOM|nr:hypothetical protein RhiirA1_486758 [Rhizophagus irregularis]
MRSKSGSLGVGSGSKPRSTSHCNSRKRFKILLASSGDNAELGVWRGKRRAVEREEEEKETDLWSWEMLLSRPELEADRSLDLERDRKRERVLAVLGLERRG